MSKSKCQLSPEKGVLDLELEVMRGLGSIPVEYRIRLNETNSDVRMYTLHRG